MIVVLILEAVKVLFITWQAWNMWIIWSTSFGNTVAPWISWTCLKFLIMTLRRCRVKSYICFLGELNKLMILNVFVHHLPFLCECSGKRGVRPLKKKLHCKVREVLEQFLDLQVISIINWTVEILIVLKIFIPILWNHIHQMLFCLYTATRISIRYPLQATLELAILAY